MTAPEDSDYTGPDAAARRLVAELAGILADFVDQCAIIGAVARNFWREPRYTKDVDFQLVAGQDVFRRLRSRLTAAGYELTRIQNENEPSGPGFVRFVRPGTTNIVEFLTAKTDFEEGLIRRSVRLQDDQPFRIATPEDIIILKLVANRPQDHVDNIELGLMEGLDWEYVERWSVVWDVSDRLEILRAGIEAERQRIRDLLEDPSGNPGE
jgi:hypothetical protein